MNREVGLEVVRALTEQVISLLVPEKLADFADDFAEFSLVAGTLRVAEKAASPLSATGLDTTLVAGMFFEVLTDAEQLPARPRERVSFVRKKAKDYLVTRLAGQITLSQFYRLLNLIEQKVEYYFEHRTTDWLVAPRRRETLGLPGPEPVEGKALRQALDSLSLALKGKRKITSESLYGFLGRKGAAWFRLLDFEAHLRVNKKTAWTYLNLLLQEGILEHNGEKANKVRYILAPPFRSVPLHPMGA